MHFVQAKGILSAKNGIEMNPDKIFSYLSAFEDKQTSAQLMLF